MSLTRRAGVAMTGVGVLCMVMLGCNASPAVDGDGGNGDGGSGTETPCTDLTYTNFAAGFMISYCTDCHSTELAGIDRQGAPDGIDYDTFDGVVAQLDRILVRAVEDGTMPPSTAAALPTADELDQLAEWIGCGAPE